MMAERESRELMEIRTNNRAAEFTQILRIIESGRASAFAAVNVALIETCWAVGQQLSNRVAEADERQKIVDNLETIILASNRRVDVTLSTTGQRSLRQYPFNAADSLTLLSQKGTRRASRRPAPGRTIHRTAK